MFLIAVVIKINMTTGARQLFDDSRYFLTGSDFSELAVLDKSLTQELNAHLDKTESLSKARFKAMDWNQIE